MCDYVIAHISVFFIAVYVDVETSARGRSYSVA